MSLTYLPTCILLLAIVPHHINNKTMKMSLNLDNWDYAILLIYHSKTLHKEKETKLKRGK